MKCRNDQKFNVSHCPCSRKFKLWPIRGRYTPLAEFLDNSNSKKLQFADCCCYGSAEGKAGESQ